MKHSRKRRIKKSRRYRKRVGGFFGLTTKSSVGVGPFKNLLGRDTKGQTALGSKEKCYSFMGKEFGCKREENNEPPSQKTASVDATTTALEPTKKKALVSSLGREENQKETQ